MRSAGPRAGRRGALDFCDDRFQFLELGNFCLRRFNEAVQHLHEACRLIRFGVSSRFGPDHCFPTVNTAVRSYKKTFGLV
ncbi:hypothetical protein [Arthrobacter sp. UYCu723]